MTAIWDARVPHGAEKNGVTTIPEIGKGGLGKGFPGGQIVTGSVGEA